MDRQLKNEIVAAIRSAEREAREMYEERWVSGDELTRYCAMFTKSWLKMYGHSLPRTRAVVVDEAGNEHASIWAYPLHQIQRKIASGEIKDLRCRLVTADSGREYGRVVVRKNGSMAERSKAAHC